MKRLLFLCLFIIGIATTALAQTPGATQYPGSLDTSTTLPRAIDNKQSALTAGINNSVTTFSVTSGSGFAQPAVVWIDSEQINCTTLSTNTFSGCTRGAGGSSAASHLSGAMVQVRPSAVYINGLQDAIIKMQTLLGTNATDTHPASDKVPVGVSSSAFLWKQITNAQIDSSAAIAYSKLNLTGAILNADLAGSIANAKLANSTISGKSLGTNLDSLTIGSGLSGSSYNGSAPITVAISAGGVTNSMLAGSIDLTSKVTGILPVANGGSKISVTKVTSQFDKTDTTLANVSGLTFNVSAGETYTFRAIIRLNLDATGLGKLAIAGTATATAVFYNGYSARANAQSTLGLGEQTSLGGSQSISANTFTLAVIEGLITVNSSGTLTVQFAQSSSSGTSSVLVGSFFMLVDTGS